MDDGPSLWTLVRLGAGYVDFVWATVWIRVGLLTLEKFAPKIFWANAWVLHHERREYIFESLFRLSLIDDEPVRDLALMYSSLTPRSY